jgi:uncharacterized CHY-type Zn-finger protein
MTPYQLTVAELSDLSDVTVICVHCGTRITLKVGDSHIPDQCPSCDKHFDDFLHNGLEALYRFYQAAKHSAYRIEFPIKQPSSQKTP